MYIMLFFISLALSYQSHAQILVQRDTILMGSTFSISIVDIDSTNANRHIDEVIQEIVRIENLISEWQPHTQISQVNVAAGTNAIKVDKEVLELTKRALAYSEMSNGAFDISTGAMDRIWKFDGTMDTLPSPEALARSVANVGYQNIVIDEEKSTLFLKKNGMKIGFGSIGKGYAADRGRAIMQEKGVKAGMVNASGDIATWGTPPNLKKWMIGIKNPFKSHHYAEILKLRESSVATSGSYEKYAEINNIRYSHIINPKTGIPSTGLTSVTIYGPSTEFANALSTSIMVLGEIQGKKLAKQYTEYKFLLITDKGKIITR